MKNIPEFNSEEEESKFWSENNSTEYIDWSKARTFQISNLKPTSKSISIRLPEHLIARLKQEANKLDVPYQSLIKILLNESLSRKKESVL